MDTCSDTKIKGDKLLNNYTAFYSLIENGYHNCGTKAHHSASRKPWWSPALELARKKLRMIQIAWIREQNKEEKLRLWKILRKSNGILTHSTCKAKKAISEGKIYVLMTIASNVKKFWKLIQLG